MFNANQIAIWHKNRIWAKQFWKITMSRTKLSEAAIINSNVRNTSPNGVTAAFSSRWVRVIFDGVHLKLYARHDDDWFCACVSLYIWVPERRGVIKHTPRRAQCGRITIYYIYIYSWGTPQIVLLVHLEWCARQTRTMNARVRTKCHSQTRKLDVKPHLRCALCIYARICQTRLRKRTKIIRKKQRQSNNHPQTATYNI